MAPAARGITSARAGRVLGGHHRPGSTDGSTSAETTGADEGAILTIEITVTFRLWKCRWWSSNSSSPNAVSLDLFVTSTMVSSARAVSWSLPLNDVDGAAARSSQVTFSTSG